MKKLKDEQQQPKRDSMDGEYIGNIWGWKLSFISLGIILGMMGLMFVRYLTMEKPATAPDNQEVTIEVDSTKTSE
jgi:predicted MFS family arabinose efflux permease